MQRRGGGRGGKRVARLMRDPVSNRDSHLDLHYRFDEPTARVPLIRLRFIRAIESVAWKRRASERASEHERTFNEGMKVRYFIREQHPEKRTRSRDRLEPPLTSSMTGGGPPRGSQSADRAALVAEWCHHRGRRCCGFLQFSGSLGSAGSPSFGFFCRLGLESTDPLRLCLAALACTSVSRFDLLFLLLPSSAVVRCFPPAVSPLFLPSLPAMLSGA